jgi:hypothetical protein
LGHHLFNGLETAGTAANTHTPQKSDVKLRVYAAVEVPASRGDAALPLQHAEVVRRYS